MAPTSEQFAALRGTPAEDWKGGDGTTFPGFFRKTRRLSFETTRCDPDRIVFAHARLRTGRTVPSRFARLAMSRETSDRFMAKSKEVGYAAQIPFRSRAEREHEALIDRAEGTQFATIGDLTAPARTGYPMGVESVQADMIGEEALPVFIGGPDNRGYYPIIGREKFQLIKSVTSELGRAKRSDFTPKYVTVDTVEHYHETVVSESERAAGTLMPQGIDTYKMQMLRNQLDLEEEFDQATLISTPTNYISANSLDCSANTNLHSFKNQSADPINDITDGIEQTRISCRQMPDSAFTSWGAVVKLRRHGAIRQAVQYGGTLERPAAMVSLQALAELFMIRIVIGAAGYASTLGAELDDIWAGPTYGPIFAILCTGGGKMMAQRFGITASKPGFPKFMPYIDPTVGSGTATVYKYGKAWATHLIQNCNTAGKSSAGYLLYKCLGA